MCVKSLRLVNPPTTQARFKNALKNSLANLVTNLKLKIVKLHFKLLNIEKIRISNYSDCNTIQFSDNRLRDLDILNPNRVGGLNQPTLFFKRPFLENYLTFPNSLWTFRKAKNMVFQSVLGWFRMCALIQPPIPKSSHIQEPCPIGVIDFQTVIPWFSRYAIAFKNTYIFVGLKLMVIFLIYADADDTAFTKINKKWACHCASSMFNLLSNLLCSFFVLLLQKYEKKSKINLTTNWT